MAPPESVHRFLAFLQASPTPYHAVSNAVQLLQGAGFKRISERDSWTSQVEAGGTYYITRNGSALVAFAVGGRWEPGNPIAMIASHTDSPCLRVKPVSKKTSAGFMQVAVETYGGGLWHTWFDRDLSLAGRVLVRGDHGSVVQKLVNLEKPILRIPTLAIHLNREANFEPNKETELLPITGLVAAELNKANEQTDTVEDSIFNPADSVFEPLGEITKRHHPQLLGLVAEQADVPVSSILDLDLSLYDTQPPCLGGLNEEFVFSARLDNLCMTFCGLMGLIESVKTTTLESDPCIRLLACFDHEEIGSTSAPGADSNLLPSVLQRLSLLPISVDPTWKGQVRNKHLAAFEQSLSTSFLLSADMAHSVHPNYTTKHEAAHCPVINKGPVVKVNANQRYATTSPGIVLLQEVARHASVPLQLFVARNDGPCGSTIGPMLSANLGVRTLDMGNPQLSMHSIRETGGSYDVQHSIQLFQTYLSHYQDLGPKILLD